MGIKLLVLGHARHGKDTVCEFLRDDFGLKFMSSSMFAAECCVWPVLKAKGIRYTSFKAMYEDRVNRRADWHEAIAAYNKDDPAKLGKELYREYDIYAGLRSIVEFEALHRAKAFDVALWVQRNGIPAEPRDSNKLSAEFADFIIPNHGTLEELRLATRWGFAKACQQWELMKRIEYPVMDWLTGGGI